VSFTPGGIPGGSYTVLSTPGSITATGGSSPITVTGLTAGVSYTFQVRANNSTGSSAYSASSNAVVPTAPFVATGGTKTTPGDGYIYHTFTGPGTFTVVSGSQPSGVVLVVAGGGGGQYASTPTITNRAAGGAGGLVYGPSSFTPTGGSGSGAYTVTVGAGGANNASGSNSDFQGFATAIGGGYGSGGNGSPGGSGGGTSANSLDGPIFGSGTPGQGYPGGAPDWTLRNNGGGGGGAGGRSIDATPAGNLQGYMGGVGLSYFGTYYAGGGGGGRYISPPSVPALPGFGVGGTGGGGTGYAYVGRPNPTGGPYMARQSTAGTVNTGGGGGGGGQTIGPSTGPSAGGSGIVIVRYPA
jgi:hypothetical protein